MRTIFLTLSLLISSLSYSAEINMQSGEVQTFSANSQTTVRCNGNGNGQSIESQQVVSTFCSCHNINSRYQLKLVMVYASGSRKEVNVSPDGFGFGWADDCEKALQRNRSCAR